MKCVTVPFTTPMQVPPKQCCILKQEGPVPGRVNPEPQYPLIEPETVKMSCSQQRVSELQKLASQASTPPSFVLCILL